jgi:histidinol dehydrogenase
MIAFRGSWAALPQSARDTLLRRQFASQRGLSEPVRGLIERVRHEGDAALYAFAQSFDKVSLTQLEVPQAELRRALAELNPAVRQGLERAAKNLATVAKAGLPAPMEVEVEPGVLVGRRADPLARVGVYAPGGQAAYPSSVLMGVVPAKVAGVAEVVVCSPPGLSGVPSDVVLAAAALAQADRVFALGGAGAIAAMAYGTATVPKCERLVGPGNAWVAEAKQQVSGEVGIDSPAGPSEILVVADETASPAAVARELIAQAEHDEDACVVALCVGEDLAAQVEAAVEIQGTEAVRGSVVRQALQSRGAVLSIRAIDEAWPIIEAFAPEHLQLAIADAQSAVTKVKHAGTVFVGGASSVAFGDYVTGANHVLPTAGLARRYSGLSVLDFVRWQTWQRVSPAAARGLVRDVEAMALSEGLPAHAAAAREAAVTSERSAVREPMAGVDVAARRRATLAPIARYVPSRPPCDIDLTDNTNLWGMVPAVREVLAAPPSTNVTRYPSPYADQLRAMLAQRLGLAPDQVVTGCGSDDVLSATFAALAEPGERLAYCPPTFSIISSFAHANGLVPVACTLEVESLLRADPAIIYLCAPNNPTGAPLPARLLETVLRQTRAVVVLDEAYVEYASTPSYSSRAPEMKRLVVVRTLSKAWALAGLRVGYATAAASVVEQIEKTRGPYKVGGLAEACALAALGPGREWVMKHIESVKQSRARFFAQLRAAGFQPLPSEANFILVPVTSAEETVGRMRERGVSVRPFTALAGVGDAVRVSIGPESVMTKCLQALVEAVR